MPQQKERREFARLRPLRYGDLKVSLAWDDNRLERLFVIDLSRSGISIEGHIPDSCQLAWAKAVEAHLIAPIYDNSADDRIPIGNVCLAREPWSCDAGTGLAIVIKEPSVDWLRMLPPGL